MYKRQNDPWVAAYFGLHTEQLADFAGHAAGYKYSTLTVSYTHLDVYKRQE